MAAESETPAGLTDALKEEIQAAYRAWLAGRGFKPRRGQRQMIAAIARDLTGEGRRCVVEAGTGTGKTVAYCLAAIPAAKVLEKKVVIATATVALQEQVVLRDLPDLQRHAGLEFSFALAKGRGRYLCLKRLDERIAYDDRQSAPLFEPPAADEVAIYHRLRTAFGRGEWDGDLDSWEEGMERRAWTPVTNDRAGCSAGRCSYYHQCPFFQARRHAAEADVIVANHDLVLADLGIGGGVVLPPPDQTIYVLDEAHHLPEKTREHFTASVRLRAANDWLTQVGANLEAMSRRFEAPEAVERARRRLAEEADDLAQQLREMGTLARALEFPAGDADARIHRFPLGEVPAPMAELAASLGAMFATVAAVLEEVREALEAVLAGEAEWPNGEQAEDWLPAIGQLGGRANAGAVLFQDYAGGQAPAARWATLHQFERMDDIALTSAPLDPGTILSERLWQPCFGAVATSATLCALGNFQRFFAVAGLAEETTALRIPSPFDFPRIAVFSVPAMQANARDRHAHTEEVAALLPALLALERSALVLCTSWQQFNAIVASLPDEVRARCQLQDAASKQRLLADHREAIDAGEPSYLIGLASFAEGVDLPGDYCRHVILPKLPFTTPDDPVDQAVAEALEQEGGNPFMEIVVPDASLRLVQACGRLIRHETDEGRITLLDRRIVTTPYGDALLEALPPYRLEVA